MPGRQATNVFRRLNVSVWHRQHQREPWAHDVSGVELHRANERGFVFGIRPDDTARNRQLIVFDNGPDVPRKHAYIGKVASFSGDPDRDARRGSLDLSKQMGLKNGEQ
jgi:hypothetical protein